MADGAKDNVKPRQLRRRRKRKIDAEAEGSTTDTDYDSDVEVDPPKILKKAGETSSSSSSVESASDRDQDVVEIPDEQMEVPSSPSGHSVGQFSRSSSELSEGDLLEVFPEANNPEVQVLGPAVEDSEEESSSDEEFDLDPNDSDDEEDQIQNQGGRRGPDPPLYRGAPISLNQSLLAILTYATTHRLTGIALSDLLSLINLHCPAEDNICKKTLYKFKRYFQNLESPLERHYYCTQCLSPLESKDDVFPRHDCENTEVSYFISISIISQLASKFKRKGFWEKLNFKSDRVKKDAANYEDIYDGEKYKYQETNGFLSERGNISLMWNSDGVKMFKSSNSEVWPFYLVINELSYSERFKKENVILAGLWCGKTKPALPLFLNSFHEELSMLYEGVNFQFQGQNEEKTVRVCLLCGSCDTPAKCHYLEFIYFNGYYGCPKCKTRGERSERTDGNHSYPYDNAPMRTDDETKYHGRLATEFDTIVFGVKRISALNTYIDDYVTSTVVDIMHCGYQGVPKTLCKLWFDDEYAQCDFSLRAVVGGISHIFTEITPPPSYIRRLPRSIPETLKLWKAAEFKSWLFYYSVPVLFTVMSPEFFNHHLLLVHGLRLLNQTSISEAMIQEAELCLSEYVFKFQDLYGYKYLSINFHMLLHLGVDVRNVSPLWGSSCMPLEDLNGQLKQLVHGTRDAPLQIASALSRLVNLRAMVEDLPDQDPVRTWCISLLDRQRLRINEQISESMWSVGRYVHLPNASPLIQDAFLNLNAEIVIRNVSQFFRLKKGRHVFYSEAYERVLKTNSFIVRYLHDGRVEFGVIQTYVRLSDCNCNHACNCPADFYAIISKLEYVHPFSIRHPQISLNYFLECTVGGPIAVSVTNLCDLCVCVKINEKMYVVSPVNTLEEE